mgnify:CR=1 FL=1
MLNKKLTGKYFDKFEWSFSIDHNGEYEHTSIMGEIYKGRYWVEKGTLYRQFESHYGEIKHSVEIYKNPEGKKDELTEYLLLTDYSLFLCSTTDQSD